MKSIDFTIERLTQGLVSALLFLVLWIPVGAFAEETTEEVAQEETVVSEATEQEEVEEATAVKETVTADLPEPLTTKEAIEIKDSLNTFNTKRVRIAPFQETVSDTERVTQLPIAPNSEGEFILRRRTIVGLDPIASIPGYRQAMDVVMIQGESKPGAFVTLTIRSEPMIQVTRADRNGDWTLKIGVDTLPAGEHAAYLQTEYKGVKSDEVTIVEFLVLAEDQISNTTWISIVLLGCVTILLLIAVNILFHISRMKEDSYNTPPVATTDDSLGAEEDFDEIESMAEATESGQRTAEQEQDKKSG